VFLGLVAVQAHGPGAGRRATRCGWARGRAGERAPPPCAPRCGRAGKRRAPGSCVRPARTPRRRSPSPRRTPPACTAPAPLVRCGCDHSACGPACPSVTRYITTPGRACPCTALRMLCDCQPIGRTTDALVSQTNARSPPLTAMASVYTSATRVAPSRVAPSSQSRVSCHRLGGTPPPS
jgi:hypothetical protein